MTLADSATPPRGEATGLVAAGGAQEAAVKSLGNRGGAITDPSLA
jgi:hypothetical protein